MKKQILILFCACLVGHSAQSQRNSSKEEKAPKKKVNTITISPGIGFDVSARGSSPNLFGYLELQRSIFRDKMAVGVVMSGKNTITKQIEVKDSIIGGKYYLIGMSLGLKVSKARSKTFNGTGFGGTFVTVWDNFNLNPEFPAGGGPYLQFVYNFKNDQDLGDDEEGEDGSKKTTYGIVFRSTYLIYGYQTNDEFDTGSGVTPGFQFRLGAAINF
jgi:hypothetical protein